MKPLKAITLVLVLLWAGSQACTLKHEIQVVVSSWAGSIR